MGNSISDHIYSLIEENKSTVQSDDLLKQSTLYEQNALLLEHKNFEFDKQILELEKIRTELVKPDNTTEPMLIHNRLENEIKRLTKTKESYDQVVREHVDPSLSVNERFVILKENFVHLCFIQAIIEYLRAGYVKQWNDFHDHYDANAH